MDKELLRLELLKICHSHGLSSSDLIARMKDFEGFILEKDTENKTLIGQGLIESAKEALSYAKTAEAKKNK